MKTKIQRTQKQNKKEIKFSKKKEFDEKMKEVDWHDVLIRTLYNYFQFCTKTKDKTSFASFFLLKVKPLDIKDMRLKLVIDK